MAYTALLFLMGSNWRLLIEETEMSLGKDEGIGA